MKINKLSYNAKVFALSVVLITSSFVVGRASKQETKPVGTSVTIEVDGSILSSYSECVKKIVENDKAFAEFEPIVSDGIACFGLPTGYRLRVVNKEDSNVGMIGVSVEDGYNVYQIGHEISGDGTSTPVPPKGCLGIHESVLELCDIRDIIVEKIKNGDSKYGRKPNFDSALVVNGEYNIFAWDGASLIDSKNLCDVVFKCQEFGTATIYYIPTEYESAAIENLRIVPADVKKVLEVTNQIDVEIQEEYAKSKTEQNVKTR